MSPRDRLLISVSVLFLLLMAGTAGYMVIEKQSFFDSMYMTVVTLSTVGYRETFQLDAAGRLLTMAIIIVGYTVVTISIANLVSLIVGGELRSLRGQLRMKDKIAKLSGHTIVCGFGRMGSQVARDLTKEHADCVVIDRASNDKLDTRDILHVQGDATDDDVLQEAGITRANALVACLASDADNVYVTLTARGLAPNIKIIARAEQTSTEPKLERAGANAVISPQIIGANKMVGILRRPHVVDFTDMATKGVDVEVAQYQVDATSTLVGKALKDSHLRQKADVMVVAIKRRDGVQVFGPGPDEVIHDQDQLVLIGRSGMADRLERLRI
ncbi:MAG: potassium channel protein [Planctomycetes bacterium]|nr:potassium channel protein [Planctomycetota bacterium]